MYDEVIFQLFLLLSNFFVINLVVIFLDLKYVLLFVKVISVMF